MSLNDGNATMCILVRLKVLSISVDEHLIRKRRSVITKHLREQKVEKLPGNNFEVPGFVIGADISPRKLLGTLGDFL